MEWPMRWIRAAVRRHGEVREYESPAYAFILDVNAWLEHSRSQASGYEHIFDSLIDGEEFDAGSTIYPLVEWIKDRHQLSLMRVDGNWDKWERYVQDLWIPGESGMSEPVVLVDVDRRVYYVRLDREILAMYLEQGVPQDWGWRAVTRDQLVQVLQDPDRHERILNGAEDLVSIAAIRRAQSVANRSSSLTKNESPVVDRVDAMLGRVRKKG